MSTVGGFRKMNWFPQPSAWKQMEAARLKRRQMVEEFQNQSSALAAGFQKVATMQIQGIGDIAAQGVQARMEAKAKQMQQELENKYAQFRKLA